MARRSKRIIPYKGPLTLTGDDLTIALHGVHDTAKWWKENGNKSGWSKDRIRDCASLARKLNAIIDHAYPYTTVAADDVTCFDHGAEQIMRLDARQIQQTRRAAQRFNRTYGVER